MNLPCYLIDYRREYFVIWFMPLVAMWLIDLSAVIERFANPLRLLATLALLTCMVYIVDVARHCRWEFAIVMLFGMFQLMVIPMGGMMVFYRGGANISSVLWSSAFFVVIDSLFTLLFAFWVFETKYIVQIKKAS